MAAIDIDTLTGPGAPVEHCGKPMEWRGSSTNFAGTWGGGFETTTTTWVCTCGASLLAEVKVPS